MNLNAPADLALEHLLQFRDLAFIEAVRSPDLGHDDVEGFVHHRGQRLDDDTEVVHAPVVDQHFENFDGHLRKTETFGDLTGNRQLCGWLDARVRIELLEIDRTFPGGIELLQLTPKIVRFLRAPDHVHDGPGIGPGKASDHDRTPSTSRTESRKSFCWSAVVMRSRRIASARSLASWPAYSVNSCRACLRRLSTSVRAFWRILAASASAAAISSRF